MENLDPPSPPNQGWENGAFLPFARLHPWFGGDGGLLFHFILSKIVGLPSRRFVHPYSLLSLRSRRLKVLNGRCLPRAPRSFLSSLLLSACYAGRTTVFLIWLTYQYLLERFHSTPVREYHPDNSLEMLWRMVHHLAPAVQWRSCDKDSSYPYESAVESCHFLAGEKSDL